MTTAKEELEGVISEWVEINRDFMMTSGEWSASLTQAILAAGFVRKEDVENKL